MRSDDVEVTTAREVPGSPLPGGYSTAPPPACGSDHAYVCACVLPHRQDACEGRPHCKPDPPGLTANAPVLLPTHSLIDRMHARAALRAIFPCQCTCVAPHALTHRQDACEGRTASHTPLVLPPMHLCCSPRTHSLTGCMRGPVHLLGRSWKDRAL